MTKVNRLVVLIDFSSNSNKLVKLSALLRKKLSAELIFVHQVSGRSPSLADAESRSKIVAYEKEEALARLQELVREERPGGSCNFMVSENSISQILDELSSGVYKEWVLVGLKETGLLKKIFIGSTASQIVDRTNLLTVAMPLEGSVFLPKKLVVAASYKYPINENELFEVLSRFSDQIKEIQFITVVTKDDKKEKAQQYLEELKDEFKKFNSCADLYEGRDAFREIKKYMKEQPDAYLVVQQGSRALTDNFFRRFMINDLVHSGDVPLIILPG